MHCCFSANAPAADRAGFTGECTEWKRKKLLGKPLQTKLHINEPGDEYEQEADRVAEQVMRMADAGRRQNLDSSVRQPLVQRKVIAEQCRWHRDGATNRP